MRPTTFYLWVDDCGIKYHTKDDAQHLLDTIGKSYQYNTDWMGNNYCKLTLEWNYQNGYVDISMPGYLQKTLEVLQHIPKLSPQYSPHVHVPIQYAEKTHNNMQLYPTPHLY